MDLLFLHAISIQWPNIYAKPIHNDDEAFLKFIYSEKATKFCKIFTLLLSYVVPVTSKVEISQNFVAFSEYMNFKIFHNL